MSSWPALSTGQVPGQPGPQRNPVWKIQKEKPTCDSLKGYSKDLHGTSYRCDVTSILPFLSLLVLPMSHTCALVYLHMRAHMG